MAKDIETIKIEIEDFKVQNGGEYSDYYIGITNNINRRIVENSSIIKEHLEKGEYTNGQPLYTVECLSRNNAVEIERFFQQLGMLKLNPRSFGIWNSKYVYCYKITEENRKMILSENSSEAKKIIRLQRIITSFKEFVLWKSKPLKILLLNII